jgi:hypothetical protein
MLGTHTLAVTARDVAGRTSERTVAFRVVATAGSVDDEIDALRDAGGIDSDGVAQSLAAKIRDLEQLVASGRTASARQRLAALAREVRAQVGKHVTKAAADVLLADIAYLDANLK